jgi:hypothetical protein
LNPNLAEEAKSKEKEEQKVMAESSKENGEQKMQTSKGK